MKKMIQPTKQSRLMGISITLYDVSSLCEERKRDVRDAKLGVLLNESSPYGVVWLGNHFRGYKNAQSRDHHAQHGRHLPAGVYTFPGHAAQRQMQMV